MRKRLVGGVASLLLFSGSVVAQTPSKPMSPEGSAHVQLLGTWAKGQRPAFTLGREIAGARGSFKLLQLPDDVFT
jgi:hypothetical protein